MELRLDEEQVELQETVGHFCAGIVRSGGRAARPQLCSG